MRVLPSSNVNVVGLRSEELKKGLSKPRLKNSLSKADLQVLLSFENLSSSESESSNENTWLAIDNN